MTALCNRHLTGSVCAAFVASVVMMSYIGCIDVEETGVPIIKNCSVAVVTDPTSPYAYIVAERQNGSVLAMAGAKDANGQPTDLTTVVYVVGDSYGKITLGDNYWPAMLETDDGYKFVFENYTNTTVDVTVHPPGGSPQQQRVLLTDDMLSTLAALASAAKAEDYKALTSATWPDQFKKWLGFSAAVAGLVVSIVGVVASGGTFFPAWIGLSMSIHDLAFSTMLLLSDVPSDELKGQSLILNTLSFASSLRNPAAWGVFAVSYLASALPATPTGGGGYYAIVSVGTTDKSNITVYVYPTERQNDPQLEKTVVGTTQGMHGWFTTDTRPGACGDPNAGAQSYDAICAGTQVGSGTTIQVVWSNPAAVSTVQFRAVLPDGSVSEMAIMYDGYASTARGTSWAFFVPGGGR